jgi:hypothetical protein
MAMEPAGRDLRGTSCTPREAAWWGDLLQEGGGSRSAGLEVHVGPRLLGSDVARIAAGRSSGEDGSMPDRPNGCKGGPRRHRRIAGRGGQGHEFGEVPTTERRAGQPLHCTAALLRGRSGAAPTLVDT